MNFITHVHSNCENMPNLLHSQLTFHATNTTNFLYIHLPLPKQIIKFIVKVNPEGSKPAGCYIFTVTTPTP